MCWFFAYFALVLFLNVYFTSLGHEVDYFFLNGDYIVDMLGEWAEKIYDITATVTVFIPPAVPTGEPPINIKSRQTIAVAFVRFSCGTVAKPAVLVVMLWNKDT